MTINDEEAAQAYADAQPDPKGLRGLPTSGLPFPDNDNPMFGYLIGQFVKLNAEHGVKAAALWFGAHCWMEGYLASEADNFRQRQFDSK